MRKSQNVRKAAQSRYDFFRHQDQRSSKALQGFQTDSFEVAKDEDELVKFLADDDNQFMSWWKSNRRTYKVRNLVAKGSFSYLLAARVGLEGADLPTALAHPDNSDISVISEEGDYYYVEEVVRGVICPYVFQVELLPGVKTPVVPLIVGVGGA